MCFFITAKKVQFSEEVQVKTIEPPDEVDIDEVSTGLDKQKF